MGLVCFLASFYKLVEIAMNDLINVMNILLHSRNQFEHRQQLEKLFIRLRNAGLKVSLAKCEFGATNVSDLGYRLPDGILPGSCKLRAVRDSKAPSTVQEVRQFMDNRNFATISAPMNRLTFKEANLLERGRSPCSLHGSLHCNEKLHILRTNCGLTKKTQALFTNCGSFNGTDEIFW
jgi:hypothetical protein